MKDPYLTLSLALSLLSLGELAGFWKNFIYYGVDGRQTYIS